MQAVTGDEIRRLPSWQKNSGRIFGGLFPGISLEKGSALLQGIARMPACRRRFDLTPPRPRCPPSGTRRARGSGINAPHILASHLAVSATSFFG